jgi:quinol monooxygenase YgiN
VQHWPDASHISLQEEVIMYARLTTFRVKRDKFDEMRRWREQNETAIYAQPGLREWIGMMEDSGEIVVVALFDDEKAARDALPQARAFWDQMAPMVEGEPTARFMEVMGMKGLARMGAAAA